MLSGTVGSAVIGFLQSILLTRTLNPEGFGLWALGTSITALTFGLLSFRSNDALNRSLTGFSSASEDLTSLRASVVTSAFIIEIACAVVGTLVILMLAPFALPYVTNSPDAFFVTVTQAIAMALTWTDRPFQGICRAARNFKSIPLVTLSAALVKLTLTGGLFFAGHLSLLSLGYLQVFVGFVTFAAQALVGARLMSRSLNLPLDSLSPGTAWRNRGRLADFWRLVNASFWSSCCATGFKQADIVLLGLFRSEAEVGLYRLAKSLASLGQSIGSALAFSAYDEFNVLIREQKFQKLLGELRNTTLYLIPAIFIVAAGGALLNWFIPLVYGTAYEAATPLLQIQLISVCVGIILFWSFPLLIALGKEWYYTAIVAIALILQFGLTIIFVPGGNGATSMAVIYTISWITIHLLNTAACLYFSRQSASNHPAP